MERGRTPSIIEIGQARLGWRSPHRLSGGVELGLLQDQLATKQSTATTEVRLRDGHEGTKTIATIAVELGSAEFAMLPAARASFPTLWTRYKRAGNFEEIMTDLLQARFSGCRLSAN
jgi:hypothetical protein